MGKTVLTSEEAAHVAVVFSPPKFPAVVSPAASGFMALNSQSNSSFKIDKLVAEQTGIAAMERMSLEEKVEQEALSRLKELQEDAYKQAYQLGLDEGREKAFQEKRGELEAKIAHLEVILGSIETLKKDLVHFNEAAIVQLVFYMARRVVLHEVSISREVVLEVVKQAIESAQSEENVTVRVSPQDFSFIESIREKLGKEFDVVKRAKIESSEEVADGGCVIETNYGDVSATIEQKLEKLWETISEKLPRVKNTIGG